MYGDYPLNKYTLFHYFQMKIFGNIIVYTHTIIHKENKCFFKINVKVKSSLSFLPTDYILPNPFACLQYHIADFSG